MNDSEWNRIQELNKEVSGLETRLSSLRGYMVAVAKAHGGLVEKQLDDALKRDFAICCKWNHDRRSL